MTEEKNVSAATAEEAETKVAAGEADNSSDDKKSVSNDAATEETASESNTIEAAVKSAGLPTDFFADLDLDSLNDDLETLLKAGAHFGHQKSRRHPRMRPYIYTVRGGVTIIDLVKTREGLRRAAEFLSGVRRKGQGILFVTTKKQAVDLLKSAASRADEPYVVNRWLGGTFTNFSVIGKRVKYLIQTEERMAKGAFRKYTKFEQLKKQEEIDKLNRKMGGLKKMSRLPGAIVVLDVKADILAVREARRAGIPVVAITDTNVDPSLVDYPIPANDDAVSSLRLILGLLLKAIVNTKPETSKTKKVVKAVEKTGKKAA